VSSNRYSVENSGRSVMFIESAEVSNPPVSSLDICRRGTDFSLCELHRSVMFMVPRGESY
jgi:hypothetical protein